MFPRNLVMGHSPYVWPLSCALVLSVLMGQQGCTTPLLEPWSPHVTEDVRAKIRTIGIGVVGAEELPRATLELPSKGATSGAGRKAGKWSGNWALSAVVIGGTGNVLRVTAGSAMLVNCLLFRGAYTATSSKSCTITTPNASVSAASTAQRKAKPGDHMWWKTSS